MSGVTISGIALFCALTDVLRESGPASTTRTCAWKRMIRKMRQGAAAGAP